MTDAARIRPAVAGDVPELLALIRDLARYEREPDAVQATESDLHRALFVGAGTPGGGPAAFCEVVVRDGPAGERVVGMALWFLTFSTWEGRHGIYLEDLYVRPEERGRGFGRDLLARLAQMCLQRGYARLEWSVLDWNTPALDFYSAQGARPNDGWTVHRVSGPALSALAAKGDTTD